MYKVNVTDVSIKEACNVKVVELFVSLLYQKCSNRD